jgi:nitrite reductase/ring-hydroxylating ferredoxin subunit
VVVRGLERVARARDLVLVEADEPSTDAVDVIVIDLDQPEAAEDLARWRERLPEAFIAGHLGTPDQDRWLAAERAGCDLVANRGALASGLQRRLPPPGARRRPRLPLLAAADVPGRLGLVVRAPDTPVGPIALYHIGGELYAVEDRCPHAGATLSEGEVDGSIVTCPRHGSQFDVCTGERTRGPADAALRTFRAVEEDGFVHLLLDPDQEDECN